MLRAVNEEKIYNYPLGVQGTINHNYNTIDNLKTAVPNDCQIKILRNALIHCRKGQVCLPSLQDGCYFRVR